MAEYTGGVWPQRFTWNDWMNGNLANVYAREAEERTRKWRESPEGQAQIEAFNRKWHLGTTYRSSKKIQPKN